MARSRRKTWTLVAIPVIVISILSIGYVMRGRIGLGTTAGAADSTSASDSTAAAHKDAKDAKKAPPRVPVEVATAGIRSISSYYVTTATLEPQKRAEILAKIAGEVVEVAVEEGKKVHAGDLLCRLDDRELAVALEEARINRDQQKRELDRLRAMHDQNLVSDKEFGDARYQYDLAQARYQQAAIRRAYTRVTAPFDGVVTERAVDPGQTVNVGSKLYVVSDVDPLQLEMFLPEAELGKIAPGQTLLINPDVDPDRSFEGRIVRIAPEVDASTGTVKVTAETRGGGIPGSFVRVRIVTDTRASALAVPRRSVVADAGERYVFVAQADSVRRVDVTVGYEDTDYAEITNGVAEGDTVVTAGVGGIRTGTKIKVLPPPADTVTAKNDKKKP